MGFEPTIGFNPYNGLANRRLQPLGHPSARVISKLCRSCTTYAGALLAVPAHPRNPRRAPRLGQDSGTSIPRCTAGRDIMRAYQAATFGRSSNGT